MTSLCAVRRDTLVMAAGFVLVVLTAAPVSAQQPDPSGPHVLTATGGFEVVNQYLFRGIRQNSTEIAMWPSADLAITPYSGEGPVRRVAFDLGFWDSLHTGDTGRTGPMAQLWYESRVSTAVRFGFGRGLTVATGYTAYTSPNNMFTTVKEAALRVAVDDRAAWGAAAVQPYMLLAFEVGAKPGEGQADGGQHAGKYIELGVTPGYAVSRARVTVPVRLGLSAGDYYELAGKDHVFGFLSVGGVVTVPLGRRTGAGAWTVHGGVEYTTFGDTPTAFNGGDESQVVGSVGVRFSY